MRVRTWAVLLALSLSGAGGAQTSLQTVWLPAQQVLLQVPAGWRLEAPLGEEEPRLLSPQGTQLRVRVWSGARAADAETAAAEYEQSLASLGAGQRESQAPLVGAEGLPGLLVQGRWEVAAEVTGAGFAAFAEGFTRVALSVWCAPRELEAARAALAAVAATVRLAGPAPPTAGLPPRGEVPAPQTTASRQSLGGFSLPVPTGWTTEARGGALWVSVPGPSVAGYCLWPVALPKPQLAAQDLLDAWAAAQGLTLSVSRRRVTTSGWLVEGTLGGALQAQVLLHVGRQTSTALVQGIFCAEQAWSQQAPTLAALLADVQSWGWQPKAGPATPAVTPWTDASGQLSLRLPLGWQAQGGARVYNGQPVVDLILRGGDAEITWRQPATPAFRELTPILQSAGEREGNLYREQTGEDRLVILSRRTPAQFVDYLLQQPALGLDQARVVGAVASTPTAGLLPGEDSEGLLAQVEAQRDGVARRVTYLCATVSLPITQGAFRWQAAYLAVEAAPDRVASAQAVLRAVVESATAAGGHDAGLAALLRGAAEAVGGLETAPAAPAGPYAPLLGESYQTAAVGSAQWSVADLLREWRELSTAGTLLTQ